MNDRKRQQNKVLRMYVRSAKKSNDLFIPNVFIDGVANAIRAFGEAAVNCANAMSEWLNSESVQQFFKENSWMEG